MAGESGAAAATTSSAAVVSEVDSLSAELKKKIGDAFETFDNEANQTVDVREVGTIIRSLGCCPSEAELHDMIAEMEDEDPTGFIRYEKFEPVLLRTLMDRRYRPASEDQIVKAFEVLDNTQAGFLTPEQMTKYMTEQGEVFSQEELEEMLSAAVEPEKGQILYRDYAAMMCQDDQHS